MDLSLCREAATWDSLVASHPFGHPLQCWGWGEVKAATGWQADRLALYDGGNLRAAAQVLTRHFPGLPITMTYVPRGPVVTPSDIEALQALVGALKEHGRRRRSLFCKVDPAWAPGDEDYLGASGFIKSNEPVQVTDTYTIDLGRSEDEILADMRSKTRQYIRKAEREETEIRRDVTGEYLNACYQVYEETAQRAGFGLHPREYYQSLFENYVADRQHLYVALRHGEVLSFLWMVCAGPHAGVLRWGKRRGTGMEEQLSPLVARHTRDEDGWL